VREPEPQIVGRARRGDAAAFEELVRACQGGVYRLALHLVRSPAVAEDVTQETFLHAYRSLKRFRGQSAFSTWLYRITRNCAVDAVRRSARQRRLAQEVAQPSPVPDPSLRVALSSAIDSLPRELREAFVLIEVFGLSYRETATVLGVVPGTLKSRMHRTRRLLIEALGEEETADEI
jgi:RNA polymerase sigma-70 factor (ECF subfamily)